MKKIILSLLLFLPLMISAQKQSLTIRFVDLVSSDGRVLVSIFNGKENYLKQKPYDSKSLEIINDTATWVIDSIPSGEYIVAGVHDENINGKMDFAQTGMPEEGFGFSNNVVPQMGPPNVDAMLFSVKPDENAVQNIKMNYLGQRTRKLSEVEVVANRKQFVTVDADKTTYQVKDNTMLSGGSMRDAVRKIPGVVLSPTGDLNYNGQAVTIYIDGVPSSLSGSDLKTYLENIPATTIEKIELVENPGASYEANANGAVLNIITRNVSSLDFGGTLNLHYGNSNGNNKFSPSLMLLGKKNKLNWQLQTGYNWHQQTINSDVNQVFTSFDPDVTFNHNSEQQNLTRNIYVRPMFNYRLTDNSYIVFNYNLNMADDQHHTTSRNYTTNYSPGIDFTTKFNNPETNRNNEFVLKYKTMLDTLNRSMQITGYYSNYYKNSTGESTQLFSTPIYGLNNTLLNLNNAYAKIDFEIPFKNFSINTGAKYNITNSHDLGKYNYNGTSASLYENPTYNDTIDFKYDERNIAAYVEARKTFGKLSATLGLRYEDLTYKSKVASADSTVSGYVRNLYPTVNLLYRLIPNINLSARYSRKIFMPAYEQLDPNVNGYFDSFSQAVGNQQLKPNFFDNYSFNISAFNYASLGSYFRYSKNISLTSTVIAQEGTLQTKQLSESFSDIKMYGAYLALPVPFGLITKGAAFFKQPMDMDKMSYAYLFTSCNFNQLGNDEFSNGTTNKPLWMFNITTHIVLPLELKLDANWFHMFTGNYQIYTIKKPMNYWQVDLSRKFMKDKLEVTVEATKQVEQTVYFNKENLQTTFHQKIDDVTFWFKLSYRFGNFKSKEETKINVEEKQIEGGGIDVGGQQ